MQENRNSSDMDRRKADLTESSSEDIKDEHWIKVYNTYSNCLYKLCSSK